MYANCHSRSSSSKWSSSTSSTSGAPCVLGCAALLQVFSCRTSLTPPRHICYFALCSNRYDSKRPDGLLFRGCSWGREEEEERDLTAFSTTWLTYSLNYIYPNPNPNPNPMKRNQPLYGETPFVSYSVRQPSSRRSGKLYWRRSLAAR